MSKIVRLVLVLAALSMAAAGCGEGGEDASSPAAGGSAKNVTLKVGVLPIADVAPLFLGIEKGFFASEGLTIEPEFAQGGAAVVPKVVSGEEQIGFSNAVSIIQAVAKGLPVQIIVQGDQAGDVEKPTSGVYVAKNSGIQRPKDLEGKTVAVVSVNNIATLTTNRAVEKDGGDHTKVKYIELPFADMLPAVESGRVDGAETVEPFTTLFAQSGARRISAPHEELARHLTVAPYFATREYIEKERDVVDRFVRAMKTSLEYAQANPDEVRAIVPTYTKIPPEVAKVMALPYWSTDINAPSVELQASLAKEYGYIDEAPALDDLIAETAGN